MQRKPEDEPDPVLGRVVAAWTKSEADAAEKSLLRFGAERPQIVHSKVSCVAILLQTCEKWRVLEA